jgi:hypothetical protein
MANPNVGQLVAQAWQKLTNDGKPEDNIFAEYSELKRLEEGKSFMACTGGRSLIGTIEYAVNSTVESITPTQPLDTTIVDVFDEWEANWKQYAGTMTLTSFEEAVNRGDARKFNLERGKLKNLRTSMRKRINTDIFGATSAATNLSGLQSLVPDSPSSGTVEGINAGTFTFWRSKQTSGAQTSSAYDNLRASMRTIRTSCSRGQGVKYPTRYVTGSGTANGYEGLLVANERIVDKKSNDKANAGFQGDVYYFGSAKLFWDADCANTRMYALNDDNLQMAYQTGYWFKGYPSVDPANQLLEVFKVETQCQLVTNNRRHLGVITAIS